LWIDGGHNASAARQVADHLRRTARDELPLVLIFASLTTKDPRAMLKPFAGLASEIHTVPIADYDCRRPTALAELAAELGFRASGNETVEQALGRVGQPARVLIFASLTTKDPRAMLKPFAGLASEIHTVPIADYDCRPPTALAELATELGFRASSNDTLEQALGRVRQPARVLIFGSLYLAGEALRANGEIPD
jgi:folylpolyglutamate synthase/dihydropteroate synthase